MDDELPVGKDGRRAPTVRRVLRRIDEGRPLRGPVQTDRLNDAVREDDVNGFPVGDRRCGGEAGVFRLVLRDEYELDPPPLPSRRPIETDQEIGLRRDEDALLGENGRRITLPDRRAP